MIYVTDEIDDDVIETCQVCGGCSIPDINLCRECLIEQECGDD